MNVVLTREVGRNAELMSWLPEGAKVDEVALTETRSFDVAEVRRRLAELSRARPWGSLVVTSARSARYVAAAIASCEGDVEVFSVGPSTTRALFDAGVTVRAQSAGGALDLSRQIRRAPVLLLGAASMRPELAEDLRSRALDVDEVACYETRPLEPDDEGRRRLAEADVVFIGAPSAWAVARGLVAPSAWVVVPGRSTAATVLAEHPRIIEGWGPSLRARLAALDGPPGEAAPEGQ
jgi:uroporphyrinogen-III synthase